MESEPAKAHDLAHHPVALLLSILLALLLWIPLIKAAYPADLPFTDINLQTDLSFYPRSITTEYLKSIHLDVAAIPEYGRIEEVTVVYSNTIIACTGTTYRSKEGQLRYCGAFKVLPNLAPGRYPVTVALKYTKKGMTHAFGEIEIMKRSIPRPANPRRDLLHAIALDGSPPPRKGNDIEILYDGPDAFHMWKKVLSRAQRRINLQTYYLEYSEKCKELVQILKEKAQQGIEVNLLVTRYSQIAIAPFAIWDLRKHGIHVIVVGEIGFPDQNNDTSQFWLDKMRRNYRILDSLPQTPAFAGWIKEKGNDLTVDFAPHEKMLIVDDAWAIAGGRNISDRYFMWWIDTDVYLEGPIVGDVKEAFEKNWKEFGGAIASLSPQSIPSTGNNRTTVQLIHSKPWDNRYCTLDMICNAMNAARHRIYLTSQYLALPPRLEKTLVDAAARGVDVRLLTNSYETGREVAFSLGHFISLNYYRPLLRAGVRLYEYRGKTNGEKRQPYIHAKQCIIDGSLVSIGSFNFSIRSAYLESEVMINVYDPAIAASQERLFLHMLKKADQTTLFNLARKEDDFGLLINLARRIEILY